MITIDTTLYICIAPNNFAHLGVMPVDKHVEKSPSSFKKRHLNIFALLKKVHIMLRFMSKRMTVLSLGMSGLQNRHSQTRIPF